MLPDRAAGAKRRPPAAACGRREGTALDAEQAASLAAAARGNILDLRASASHAAGHLPGAVTLPLEPALAAVAPSRRESWLAAELPSIFLPPRHEPLLVVAEQDDLARLVAAHLTARGRAAVAALVLDGRALGRLPDGLRERGRSSRTLWRPPGALRRWAHLLPPPAAGPVLDLACGSGRAAVWLAGRGWRVTGIDHQPEALALARRLAAGSGVELDLRAADLRRPGSLPPGRWAAVLFLRFLDRDLVRAAPSCLLPGGVALLSTFRDAPGFLGNPRRQHRLGRDEAARLWAGAGVQLLVHEEGFAADGKPITTAICRRDADPGARRERP
jgi:tellurite methyltransferase